LRPNALATLSLSLVTRAPAEALAAATAANADIERAIVWPHRRAIERLALAEALEATNDHAGAVRALEVGAAEVMGIASELPAAWRADLVERAAAPARLLALAAKHGVRVPSS